MSTESTPTKLARLEEKIDNLKVGIERVDLKADEVRATLNKDYVTQDQLDLKLSEYKPLKALIIWLLGIVALETIGLLFYLVRALIEQRAGV